MPANYYQQIRRRYIFAVTAVLAMLAGLFGWHAVREYRLIISGAEKRSASYASALKEHSERVFSETDFTLKKLVEDIQGNGGIPYARERKFYKRLSSCAKSGPQVTTIFVVDKNGDVVAHSLAYRMKAINLADRDYFLHSRDNPAFDLYVSKPYKSRITNSWRFCLSRPLRDSNGRFMGLVGIGFETSYFEKFYTTIDVGKNGRIILSTTGGDILVHEPFSEKAFSADFKQSLLVKKYLPAVSSGTYQVDKATISLTPRIISYSKLSNLPVVSVVSFDRAEVVAPWLANLYMQGAIAFLLSACIALFSFLFLQQVRRLEQTSLELEAKQQELLGKSAQIIAAANEWRGTFDALEDAVWVLDRDQRIIRANKATQAIFGKSPQEVVGMLCCQATYNKIMPRKNCPFVEMLETGKRGSAQLVRENRWFEVSVDPIFDKTGEIIKAVYIAKDIDGLKKAELREHVRSEILERIARGEPLPQLLSFIVTVIERERPEALCSIMLADEDGKHLVNGAAPSLPEFYNRAVNRTRIGEGIGSCGTAAFRKERIVVEDIDTHPFWKGFAPAQEAGLRSCWSEPIISSAGQLLGTFAIYRHQPAVPGYEEIHLIKQAAAFAGIALERSQSEGERAELELQLGQSQKMEAIGHLAGGVAHDFNNLLTPIIVYADLLKRALANEEKLLPKIEGIVKASHKARDLTQQLLSFGRKQVMQMQILDLNEVVSSFQSIMRRTLRESIDITLQLSAYPAVIRADRSKIDQVILNLAINAQDAIGEIGQVAVGTGQVMIDDEYARLRPGMETGRYAMLSFRDSGCGMSDEIMRHIFEPFFTTKQVGHGTGLGLANVYGIVKQHKGYIDAQSKIGVGTTFSIYFPLVDEKPDSPAPDTEGHVVAPSGNETILLVEDNDMVRVMAAELLEGLGYRVYVAGHPEQALELVGQHPEKIDLVITDVVMPGMNGQQLFERINGQRPDIDRVLYISGYTNNIIVTDGVLEEEIHFLPKPFTLDALVDKVRGLLQQT